MDLFSTGERFKEYVERQGMTIADVAKELGMNKQTLYGFARGDRAIGIDKLIQLKQFLPGLDMNWLMTGKNNEPEPERPFTLPVADEEIVVARLIQEHHSGSEKEKQEILIKILAAFEKQCNRSKELEDRLKSLKSIITRELNR